MARTVRDLVSRSLRLAGAYGTGESIDANDAADALLSLNQMLDGWSADNLLIYTTVEFSQAMTAGLQNYTVGPTGTIVTPRPTSFQYIFTRDQNGIDRQLTEMTQEDFASIELKNIGNTYPSVFTNDGAYPNCMLTFYPYPIGNLTLFLGMIQPLTSFASLDTVVSLPPGYEEAIVYNLALCVAPEYERNPTPWVVSAANKALGRIRSLNIDPQYNAVEFSGVGNLQWYTKAQFLAGN